jgi:SAM-dependent methyltransferase
LSSRERYERFLRDRHRHNHARRSAASHAGFLLPHLKPGMRLLDLGCGPASITAGLGDGAIGVDVDPGPSDAVPLVAAEVYRLPFSDATFDAVFCCAVLQHLNDPLAALREARRLCRAGAVIGVADADWGGQLRVPNDPLLHRGQVIQEALRGDASPYVGARLRGWLHEAGFVNASSAAKGSGGGDLVTTPRQAAFNAAMFDSPDTLAVVVEEGIATVDEMLAVAEAWRRWGDDPGAVAAGWWFEALAWVPHDVSTSADT